jgi:predicted AAA+ superfamily ATPase
MIDKNVLFRIFSEKDEKFSLKITERYCSGEAIKYLGYKEILAITGVRRSGKTYLMFYLMQHLLKKNVPEENILYLNFEDERLAFISPEDLDKIYEWYIEFSKTKGKLYFFLDEIQNVPMWEKWLSRSFDKIKFVISGSNSTLLSSELATAITGRHIEMSLYPFSFKEYISYKDKSLFQNMYSSESSAKISNYFKEYLDLGGFPEISLNGKKDLLRQYYKTILLRDVISRYNIKYKDYIEKLSLYLVSNVGKQISLYALAKENPIGINTIKNYLNFIEKCFLLFFINKFDYSLKKQHANPKKVYAVDIALAREISFKFTEDKGRVLENIVFIELKRRNKDSYYHKGTYECDFVIKEGLKISEAIQVCFDMNDDNRKRELNGLLEAMEKYALKHGIIITNDQEGEIQIKKKKITLKKISNFLLET